MNKINFYINRIDSNLKEKFNQIKFESLEDNKKGGYGKYFNTKLQGFIKIDEKKIKVDFDFNVKESDLLNPNNFTIEYLSNPLIESQRVIVNTSIDTITDDIYSIISNKRMDSDYIKSLSEDLSNQICDACDGDGVVTCYECDGSGDIDGEICDCCVGSGVEECEMCFGSGLDNDLTVSEVVQYISDKMNKINNDVVRTKYGIEKESFIEVYVGNFTLVEKLNIEKEIKKIGIDNYHYKEGSILYMYV